MSTTKKSSVLVQVRDSPPFGWASRSLILSLWLVSALLWCVLMRQAFISMPWDTASLAGIPLYELRMPFAEAGMSVGVFGACIGLGALFWLCLSCVIGSSWGISMRRIFAAMFWGFMPGLLVLCGTVGCLTTLIFPEVALYWGKEGVRAFGVLDVSDFSWWNPAWLYLRMGAVLLLAWIMGQMWSGLVARNQVWDKTFCRGRAALCMIIPVMTLGLLGIDILGGSSGTVLSMFPVYLIAYALLASLACALLVAVLFRGLDGGDHLSWIRMGGMLTAMVLIKAYIVYSQYLVTWYAAIPEEFSFYAAACSGWSLVLVLALTTGLLLPFAVLLFPALRRNPRVLGMVCLSILAGSFLEACWLFGPQLGVSPDTWLTWLPLILLGGVVGAVCLLSVLGGLSARRIFPERT